MRSLLPAALLGLAACQPTVAPPGGNPAFAQELAGLIPGTAETCVSTLQQQNLRVIDPRTVAYDVGPTVWVNRLAADCPSLSPHNTIIVEAQGSQYCRGDRIRAIEPGAVIPGPVCILRDWVPYRRP